MTHRTNDNHYNAWRKVSLLSILSLSYFAMPQTTFATQSQSMDCDVVIIGAGPAGTHTAYQLVKNYQTAGVDRKKVCLVDKQSKVGGRFRDYPMGVNGAIIATAAQRFYTNQYTRYLMDELNMSYVPQTDPLNKIISLKNPNGQPIGKRFAYSGADFAPLYNVNFGSDDDVFALMLCGPQVPKVTAPNGGLRPDFTAIPGIKNMNPLEYLKYTLNNNNSATQYMLDIYRFRSDFATPYDAVSYMQYIAEDYAGDFPPSYVEGGFSQMLKKMENVILDKPVDAADNAPNGSNAAQVKYNEAVKSVTKTGNNTYKVETDNYNINAKAVVIAADANALKYMTNRSENDVCADDSKDMVHKIISQKFYKHIQGAPALSVTHRWSKPWWQGDLRYPQGVELLSNQLSNADGKLIRRLDSKLQTQKGFWTSFSELGISPYQDSNRMTRSVYTDDLMQVPKWAALASQGDDAVNAEIIKLLNMQVPKVFTSSNLNDYKPSAKNKLPKIEKTQVTHVKNAWYGLKEGAYKNGVTHKTIFEWATQPIPGEKIYLAGDAYYPSYGWSASAYTSSANLLNKRFNLNLDLHLFPSITCTADGQIDYDKLEVPNPNMQ